jgi:hypothetical protein
MNHDIIPFSGGMLQCLHDLSVNVAMVMVACMPKKCIAGCGDSRLGGVEPQLRWSLVWQQWHWQPG